MITPASAWAWDVIHESSGCAVRLFCLIKGRAASSGGGVAASESPAPRLQALKTEVLIARRLLLGSSEV